MKYYLSPTSVLYAYELDGSQDNIIPADFIPATDAEVYAITHPAQDLNKVIVQQIATLEATITQRRLREAMLTDAGKTWLENVDAQIAALRATLT